MIPELQQLVQTGPLATDEITRRTRQIYETVLRNSRFLDAGNFSAIHPDDLELLFDQYDRHFFGGSCRRQLAETRLDFRLSKRMTRAGGKTTRFTPRNGLLARPYFEIAISTTLLFQTFYDGDRPITVTGIVCRDRLEALQRVFEHELIHLIEMLLWTNSNCRASRFQSIALRLFGHTKHTHELITPRERAFTQYGIRPGSRVRFRFEGTEYVGIVNRITKRASVLVENRSGPMYSDGKRYAKFYVPLEMLEPVENG